MQVSRSQLERGPETDILPDAGRGSRQRPLPWKPLCGEEAGMQGSGQGQVTGVGEVKVGEEEEERGAAGEPPAATQTSLNKTTLN